MLLLRPYYRVCYRRPYADQRVLSKILPKSVTAKYYHVWKYLKHNHWLKTKHSLLLLFMFSSEV